MSHRHYTEDDRYCQFPCEECLERDKILAEAMIYVGCEADEGDRNANVLVNRARKAGVEW